MALSQVVRAGRSVAPAPVVVIMLALAGPSIAAVPVKRIGGVVPDVPAKITHAPPILTLASPTARIANLPYAGGPVMHSNRTHVIFWQPSASGLSYDPGYEVLVESFLRNVAADSRQLTNVYSLTGQYRDSSGPAAYASTYAGSVVATDRLPRKGCDEPRTGPPGWRVCLNDTQLENEIQHVIATNNLPTTQSDIYFLVMPNGMGTCETNGPENCALGGGADGSFCGYHSSTPDGRILYAVIPYNAVPGHCQSDSPRPNASTADPALSTLSHEHSETVTDPLGDAWIDGSGNENGDLCIQQYGPVLGGSGASSFNELIHGGHYYLQEEWSNEDRACRLRDESDRVSFANRSPVTAHSATTFTARASDPDGGIVAYDWSFGDGTAGQRRVTQHRFARQGSYRVILRITDSTGNRAFYTRTVRVIAAAKDVEHRSTAHRR